MRYNLIIAICVLAAILFFTYSFSQDANETERFLEKYSYLEEGLNLKNKIEYTKWTFELRLDDYHNNLDRLKVASFNMLIIIVLGILLIFFRPNDLEVPFISLKIPEGLLYIVIIFGSIIKTTKKILQQSSLGSASTRERVSVALAKRIDCECVFSGTGSCKIKVNINTGAVTCDNQCSSLCQMNITSFNNPNESISIGKTFQY